MKSPTSTLFCFVCIKYFLIIVEIVFHWSVIWGVNWRGNSGFTPDWHVLICKYAGIHFILTIWQHWFSFVCKLPVGYSVWQNEENRGFGKIQKDSSNKQNCGIPIQYTLCWQLCMSSWWIVMRCLFWIYISSFGFKSKRMVYVL